MIPAKFYHMASYWIMYNPALFIKEFPVTKFSCHDYLSKPIVFVVGMPVEAELPASAGVREINLYNLDLH